MDYEKVIKEAAERRKTNKMLKEKSEQVLTQTYLNTIKSMKERIKAMLKVEKMLIDNDFVHDELCTDCMCHKVGFASGKKGIGIYAGGACGEWDLIVDEDGTSLMYGCGTCRVPNYCDINFLKQFVNKFSDFESRVEKFVSSL